MESTGQNLSLAPLVMILLWALTKACSSLDCRRSLRKPSSSSVEGSSVACWSDVNSRDSAIRGNWDMKSKTANHETLGETCKNARFSSWGSNSFFCQSLNVT